MKKVLLLTKNVLAEEAFQHQLQMLNYEVLSMYTSEIDKEQFSKFAAFFRIVIFSETMCNDQIEELTDLLSPETEIFYKRTRERNEDGAAAGERIIYADATIEEIREKIYFPTPISVEVNSKVPSLSKLERGIFSLLYEAQGEILSREEICQQVWESGVTDSNLSQLSYLIKKIRGKLLSQRFPGTIETIWRRGYRLLIMDSAYFAEADND